jgi:integrase
MATVYKRDDSQFYQATLTNFRGERVRLSLKTASRREAYRRVKLLEGEQGFEDILSEADALYMIRKLRGEIGSLTIRGWFAQWVEDIAAPSVSWATYRAYRNAAGKLCKYLGKGDKRPLHELSLADLLGFRAKLQADGRAPKTCNNILKYIRASLSLAVKMGNLERNCAELIKPLPLDNVERRAFTEEELSRLVKMATGDWKTAVLVGLYTGQRLRDCVSMKWESLNLKEGSWNLVQGKTGKRLCVPLAESLSGHLRTCKRGQRGFVMRTLGGRGTGGKYGTTGGGLSDEFARLLVRSGIQRKVIRSTCRRVYDVSFHSLRHTFDSMLANKGVTREVRERLGIAEGRVHVVYEHLEEDFLRQTVNLIPSVAP